ncbi:MAG: hypothetical protein IT384_33915 [Deltaproteobacteria bacterium]|nr:hypothetical protein [Deltaproteobacteria bacterium]
MGADQIAELRPPIVEVLAARDEGEDFCATFELSGDASSWVQVTSDCINGAYPHQDEPSEFLDPPLHSVIVQAWEPGKSVTLGFDSSLSAREIAVLVDSFFERVLGCLGRDYSVDVTLERLS